MCKKRENKAVELKVSSYFRKFSVSIIWTSGTVTAVGFCLYIFFLKQNVWMPYFSGLQLSLKKMRWSEEKRSALRFLIIFGVILGRIKT